MIGNDHQFKNGHFELPAPVLHAGHVREPIGGFATEAEMIGSAERAERRRLNRTIGVEILARPNGSFGGLTGGVGTGIPEV
jgi:hypothetical protein